MVEKEQKQKKNNLKRVRGREVKEDRGLDIGKRDGGENVKN